MNVFFFTSLDYSNFQGAITTPLVGLIQLLTVELFFGELF